MQNRNSLVETPEPTMTDRVTPNSLAGNLLSAKPPESWLKLETFGDPVLAKLKAESEEWCKRFITPGAVPCWLTICGKSETGKTYVADQIWKNFNFSRKDLGGNSDWIPEKIWWPGYVNSLRAGNRYDHLADTAKWALLYVDEIGANRDTTGYVTEQLYILLGQRERKWTVLTTNLTMDQLGAVDERIVSRCFRHGGIVVEVNTTPFSKR